MKSIAIWYTPTNSETNISNKIELHFNFWKIPNGSKVHHKFLDIGIKLEATQYIELLNIFLPVVIDNSDFEDIVSKFIDKPELVNAIFNENYKVLSDGTSKSYAIKNTKGEPVFTIYKTSTSDMGFRKFANGTIISIKILKQEEKSYYRFRLKGDFVQSLSTIYKPTNAILESAFSEIEMIDFRINEIRDLNQDLLETIRKEVLPEIVKQHFFFICSNEEEVIGNHQPFSSCRNLENYRWDNYVDFPKEKSSKLWKLIKSKQNIYLAYHWKEEKKESVSILIKTKYEKNNWRTIGKYLLYGIIIAVLIELFSNTLYDFLK
ncbi:MAG: hypothetical protein QM535_15250 [Limnohabitans sp.]|nr:hypothetical protein [Limnohabitans sp.]